MLNIAVLVSGGGTNLQALIDAEKRGEIPGGKLALVLASKPGVFALERARRAGIPTSVLVRKEFPTQQEYDQALLARLDEARRAFSPSSAGTWCAGMRTGSSTYTPLSSLPSAGRASTACGFMRRPFAGG